MRPGGYVPSTEDEWVREFAQCANEGGCYRRKLVCELTALARALGAREERESIEVLVHEASIRADRDEGHPGATCRGILAAIRARKEPA